MMILDAFIAIIFGFGFALFLFVGMPAAYDLLKGAPPRWLASLLFALAALVEMVRLWWNDDDDWPSGAPA